MNGPIVNPPLLYLGQPVHVTYLGGGVLTRPPSPHRPKRLPNNRRTYFFRALEFPSDDVRPDRKSRLELSGRRGSLGAVGNLGFTQRGPNLISTRKVKIWQHRLLICNTILGSPAKSIAQYRKKKKKKRKKKNLPSDCSQKIPKVDQKYQESSESKIDTKIGGKCH